jgi:tRNA(fMet)-specific endonuclease VapC
MRYLLDANVLVALLRNASSTIATRLKAHAPADIAVPAIVMHELYYGAFKSARPEHHRAVVDALQFQVLEFDREDARRAGEIRAALGQQGQPIGPYDVLIAGQALSRGLILVTNNRREFDRVAGMTVESWS